MTGSGCLVVHADISVVSPGIGSHQCGQAAVVQAPVPVGGRTGPKNIMGWWTGKSWAMWWCVLCGARSTDRARATSECWLYLGCFSPLEPALEKLQAFYLDRWSSNPVCVSEIG